MRLPVGYVIAGITALFLGGKAAEAKTPVPAAKLSRYLTEDQMRLIIYNVNKSLGNPFLDDTVLAVAKVESGSYATKNAKFDSQAYRYEPAKGEASYGVSQVLASTARDMGLKGDPKQLYNPSVCVRISILYLVWIRNYLRSKLKREPTLREILYSYNGGVGTFLRNRNGTPATRQYVERYNTAVSLIA